MILFILPIAITIPFYLLALLANLQLVYYVIYGVYIIGSLLITKHNQRTWNEIGITRNNLTDSLLQAIGFVSAFIAVQVIRYGYHLNPNLLPLIVAEQAVYNFIFSGLAQEILFRGLLLFSIWRWKGPKTAIIASSVTFGLVHITKGISYVIGTMLIGSIYGYITYKTKNIIGPTIAHGLNNFILGFILIL